MVKAQDRTLTIEHVPIGDLCPDRFNPRRISDGEVEALGVFTRCWRALGLTWSMELDGRMRGSGLG